MADRSVTVRLTAITTQYEESMRRASKATKDVGDNLTSLNGDSDNLERAIRDLTSSMDKFGTSTTRAGKAADDAHGKFRPLLTTIAALGPALIPLGAAAAATVGSFALMGASGVLAIKGIENEMKAGTPLGRMYAEQVNTLKSDLAILEETAARGVLRPFADMVAELHAEMPNFNTEIALFADIIGKIGGNVGTGLITGFRALEPVLTEIGNDAEGLSEKFKDWTTNGGLQRFGESVQANLPGIESALSEIGDLIVRLAQSIGPLGVASLSTFGLIARALNALPLGVLQTLVPLLISGYVAFQAYKGLSAIAESVKTFTTSLKEASLASRLMTASMGAIGIGLAVLTTIFASHAKTAADAAAAEHDFRDALIQTNGVVTESILQSIEKKLLDEGVGDAVEKAGISLHDLATAVAGTDDQLDDLYRNKVWTDPNLFKNWDNNGVFTKINSLHDAFQKDAKEAQQVSAANGEASQSTDDLANASNNAKTAVSNLTNALEAESTAAGGDVVRAQDAAQESLNSLADTLKQGKGAFDAYSSAGLNSRQAVDQAASAAATLAAQVYAQTGSAYDAAQAYDTWYAALVATAQQQGLSKQQLDAYLSSVGQLPAQVQAALAGMVQVGANSGAALVAGLNSQQAGAFSAGANIARAFLSGYQGNINGGAGGHLLGVDVPKVSPPAFHVGSVPLPSIPPISVGSVTPPKVRASGSSPVQTALDKIKARDDLLDAQARAAISPTNKLALAQEAVTDAVRRLNNETTKGTTEYYEDLIKVHQAQSDLDAEIKAEAQARADAQKQLAQDQAAYKSLLDQEAATTKQYYADLDSAAQEHAANDAKLIADRQNALEQWANAGQKAVVQWGDSINFLTGNVQDQVDQFTQWQTLLAQARQRGVSEQVIEALGLDQGPQALGQLKQFANATQAQIDALNQAVAQKNQLAGQEAQDEAAHRYGQLGQDLVAEQQRYADAVLQLQQRFQQDMANLAQQAKDAQDKITQDQQALGPQYVHVPSMSALNALPAGTPLYTHDSSGYHHISGPSALAGLPPGTAIYEKMYDAGGTLPPGFTVAYNGTGRNEHVFTDAQLSGLAPQVRVFIGSKEITENIRVEVSRMNGERRNAIQIGGVR